MYLLPAIPPITWMMLLRNFEDISKIPNQLIYNRKIIWDEPDLIRWTLKREWALPEKKKLEHDRLLTQERFFVAGIKDGEVAWIRFESGFWEMGGKKIGMSVLQPQGPEFCQWHKQAWTQIFPIISTQEQRSPRSWFHSCKSLNRWPVMMGQDC